MAFANKALLLPAQSDLNENMNHLHKVVKEFNLRESKKPSDIKDVTALLNEIAYLFKSSEYQHEYEVRLVVKDNDIFEKNIDSSFHPPRVYIKLVSLRPSILRITLGPKVERQYEWTYAIYYSLNKDVYTPDILISELPFK